ncbi:MAG: arsenate reductase ArsC [Bacteroidales bacterium]|nr:arsenate reductase ArsC [Bacteroidales bacterium]MCF8405312.1 arsenate reductase ArsC [Bacteroidales bacterium]
MKVLVLCTGNSCRSHMAEAFLRSFDQKLEVFSAGTLPEREIHPLADKVMSETGIPLNGHFPKNVDGFLHKDFDFLVTVCERARESCPEFKGSIKKQIHIGISDPVHFIGNEEETLKEFRKTRDIIKSSFYRFYLKNLNRGSVVSSGK